MPNPEDPKDPDEDREPQRREDVGGDEEADIDESKRSPMARLETDEEELAEDDMLQELSEDDLRDMAGPDA